MLTKSQILTQLKSLRHTGFDAKLEQHATAHGFPTAFFFAIASRETNCQNILGDKDKHGQFHGVGIVQIDIQHEIARKARDSGSFKTNPDPLIEFGAQMLKNNISKARESFPNLSTEKQLKVAASGYNCGIEKAIAAQKHGDSDLHTTGHDYGKDVIARMIVFEELIAGGN